MEGMESVVLCRDAEDYDEMVKILCICARRKNVLIIIYAVVSNHCHVAVLAAKRLDADQFGSEIKRIYSMWFSRRYGETETFKGADVKAIELDSDWYVRNALAYIPRNALDNGYNVNSYPWSGYRAMFGGDSSAFETGRPVAVLTKVEKRAILHTGDSLKDVPWLLDEEGHLIPSSFCDTAYLEQAFEGDPAFFFKTIGILNSGEMKSKLVDQPRRRYSDNEFYKMVNETALRFYKMELSGISLSQKYRLMVYMKRTCHTTVPQLARVLGMTREQVTVALGNNAHRARSPETSKTLPEQNAPEWPEWPF